MPRGGSLLRRSATWWREILLIAALYGAYELTRGAGDVDVKTAFANGKEILHLERVWHLAPEHVLNVALQHSTFVAVLASYFYSLAHYLVTPAVLIWMYRKHRAAYGPARTALAISTALALFGYLFVPTAPPRMLKHSGLADILADTSNWGWWSHDGSVPRGLGGFSNQYAAMPSMHVGWAVWAGVLVAIYARRRWVKALGIAYPIATTMVVMATGNHYLFDALAGVAAIGVGAAFSYGVPRLFARRPVVAPVGPDHESLDSEVVPEFCVVRD